MTSPGQPAPDGAFVIGGGESYGQTVSNNAVKSMFKVPTPNPLNSLALLAETLLKLPLEALQGFKELLPGSPLEAFDTVVGAVEWIMSNLGDSIIKFLQQLINQIMDIFNNLVVVPINAAIQGIKDWWDNLWGFRKQTADTQLNLQNFQITALTYNTRNAAHTCRYPIGDVTYPEFINAMFPIFGTTGPASTGTAHTHSIDGSSDASAEPGVWSVVPGNARGGYITTTVSTIYDTLGINIRKNSGTLNNVYLEILRERSDGSAYQVFSEEVSALVTTSTAYLEIPTNGIIANAGERYLVRIRNSSTVATTIWISGLNQTGSAYDYSWLATGADATKTEYTGAESATLRAASSVMPWILLAANNLPASSQSHSDDFGRPALGALWYLRSNTSNLARISGGKFSYNGTTDGNQYGIYVRPTSSPAQRLDFDLSGVPEAASGAYSGGLISCNREMTQMVMLQVNNGGSRIVQGAWNSLTVMASDSQRGNGKWTIYYDEDLNTYFVAQNGNLTDLFWEDTGNIINHGEDYLYGGLRVSRATFFSSPQIDNFTLQDWVPATP